MANFCTKRVKLFVGKEELKRRGMKVGRNQISSEEFRKGAIPQVSSRFLPFSSHTYSVIPWSVNRCWEIEFWGLIKLSFFLFWMKEKPGWRKLSHNTGWSKKLCVKGSLHMSFRKINLTIKWLEGVFPPLTFLKASSSHLGGLSINLTNPGNANKITSPGAIALSEWTSPHASAAGTFHEDESDLRHPATVDKI